MSIGIILLIVGALIFGLLLGYYLRLVISLGKKGSMELEIKRMMFGAKKKHRKF